MYCARLILFLKPVDRVSSSLTQGYPFPGGRYVDKANATLIRRGIGSKGRGFPLSFPCGLIHVSCDCAVLLYLHGAFIGIFGMREVKNRRVSL